MISHSTEQFHLLSRRSYPCTPSEYMYIFPKKYEMCSVGVLDMYEEKAKGIRRLRKLNDTQTYVKCGDECNQPMR